MTSSVDVVNWLASERRFGGEVRGGGYPVSTPLNFSSRWETGGIPKTHPEKRKQEMSDSATIADSRRFCFFIVDNEIVDNYRLSSNALLAYLSIVRSSRNGSCTLSIKFLANQVGMSRATFVRTLPELKKSELIRVEVAANKGASTYTLLPVRKGRRQAQSEPTQAQSEPTPESTGAYPQAQSEPHINTKYNTSNTKSSFPDGKDAEEKKPKRKSRKEIFEPFSDTTKQVVNRVLEIWPHKRSGNNSKIQPDIPLLANRVDEILHNPKVTAQLLIRAAERYLAEARDWPHAPEFFFGPGKKGGDGPPWRAYARMEWYEQQKTASATAGSVQ